MAPMHVAICALRTSLAEGLAHQLLGNGGAVAAVVANCALKISLAEGLAQPKVHQLQNIGGAVVVDLFVVVAIAANQNYTEIN